MFFNNLISSTQIDYHETLNLPVAVNDPAGRITAYTYDGRGNLVSRAEKLRALGVKAGKRLDKNLVENSQTASLPDTDAD